MNKQQLLRAIGLLVVAVFLEVMPWPTKPHGLFLGAGWLLGILSVVRGWPWLYLVAAGLGAIIGGWLHGVGAAVAIPVHFCLFRLSARSNKLQLVGLAAGFPLFMNSLLTGNLPNYWPHLLINVAMQVTIYYSMKGVLSVAWETERRQNNRQKASELLRLAGKYEDSLTVLLENAHSLSDCSNQVYSLYQEWELLTRTNPNLPAELTQAAFQAAEQLHSLRLETQKSHRLLLVELADAFSSSGCDMVELAHWVALAVADQLKIADLNISIELTEKYLVPPEQQLALANSLLVLAEMGAETMPRGQGIHLHLNAFASSQKMRVLLRIFSDGETTEAWPPFKPLQVPRLNGSLQILAAQVNRGVVNKNHIVYTLEFSWFAETGDEGV